MRHKLFARIVLVLGSTAWVACDSTPFEVQVSAQVAELRSSAAADSKALRKLEHLSVMRVQKPKPWQSDAFYKLVQEDGFVERKDVLTLPLTSEALTVTASNVAMRQRDGDGLGALVPDGALEVGAVIEAVVQAPWVDDKLVAVVRDGRAIGFIERADTVAGRASVETLGQSCLDSLKRGDWATTARFAAAISKRPDAPRFFAQLDQLMNHPNDKPKLEAEPKLQWSTEVAEADAYVTVFGQMLQGQMLAVGQPVTVTKLGKRGDEPIAEISVTAVERVLVTGAFTTSPPTLTPVTRSLSGVVPGYALTKTPPTTETLDAAIASTSDRAAKAALHAARYVPGQSPSEALDDFVAAAVAAERADLLLKALQPTSGDQGLTGPAIVLGCIGDPAKAAISDGADADKPSPLRLDAFEAAPHCLANYDTTPPCEPSLVQDHDCGATPAECAALAAKRRRELAERLKVYKKDVLPLYKRALAKLATYKNPSFAVPAPVAQATSKEGADLVLYRYPATWQSIGPCEAAIAYGGDRAELTPVHLSEGQARAALFVAIAPEKINGWRYGAAITSDTEAVKRWLASLGTGDGRDPMLAFKFVEAPAVADHRCESTCDAE